MALKSLLTASLMATSALAKIDFTAEAALTPLCGTEPPSDEQRYRYRSRAKSPSEESIKAMKEDGLNIDLVFHVIAASETEGNSPDEQIKQQIDVVNEAYAPHNIFFNHVETIRTFNETWASGSNTTAMQAELRKGSYATLNVYSMISLYGPPLGRCNLPEAVEEGDDAFLEDGCTIVAGTMPGGDVEDNDQGGTLVHEIGHWMDLYHTFENGCDAPGDYVDDTPAEAGGNRECKPDVVYDSCPNQPGNDPVHNWMSYTGEACWEEFTKGQEDRMYSSWQTFRAGK